MSKFVDFVAGAIEVVAGVLLLGPTFGASAMLIVAGAGMIIAGIGTLLNGNNQPGLAWASRNPIKAWDCVYGRAGAGTAIIYIEDEVI